MVVYPYLVAQLEGGQGYRYEFVGWENVEGHRCAVVRLAWTDEAGEVGAAKTFWLDMARGGHALRFENHVKGNLAMRVSGVKLAQVGTKDERPIWFPVKALQESFGDGLDRYSSRPNAQQTFAVLDGTLRVNQGLNDQRFNLDFGLDAATVARARKANKGELTPPDNRNVDERLRDATAEVETKSEERVASSPSKAPWYEKYGWSLGIAGLASLAIVAAGVLRRRA